MEPRFNHIEQEKELYKAWESSGYFNPDNLDTNEDADPFTIIMPPPNANGSLHAGHALFITLQDILTRYNRMKGKKALWVPGADHAGFETQIVYEKKLEKEGRSRFGMDPQELYKEILDFTLENKTIMEDQVRALGASCDWSREKFTLDEDVVRKTQEVFKKLYDDDLVYRAKRPVNWCTKHQTSLSDVETETVEKEDVMYHVQYGPLVVATVRPETFFGDVAVVIRSRRIVAPVAVRRHFQEVPQIGPSLILFHQVEGSGILSGWLCVRNGGSRAEVCGNDDSKDLAMKSNKKIHEMLLLGVN